MLVIGPDAEATSGLRDWLAMQRAPSLHVTHVDSLDAGVMMLSVSQADALVLDLSAAAASPLEACRRLRAAAPHAAIVLTAPVEQEAVAVQALQEGADHYSIKGPSDGRATADTVSYALRRARVEAELRDEKARHRRLLDMLDDGVAVLDADGCVVEANAAMARILGYDGPYELRGTSIRDVYAGPDAPDTFVDRLATSGTLPRAEAELLCRDGERVTVLLRGHVVPTGAESQATYEIVCTDVTTERRLEQEARQAEPVIVAGMLAAGVGVEVQRLMTASEGAHELLAEVIDDGHPRRADLQYSRETAARAAALSEELLVAFGRRGSRPTVLEAAAVLERLQATLLQTVGGEVAVRMPPAEVASGQVTFVPGELDGVVLELASVARSLEPNAALTVATAPVYLDATYAREHLALIPGHFVAFVITTSTQSLDTLVAPSWEAERSFSPAAADRQVALELATIYRTVNQAGGHFAIRRAPGSGTTFKVYVPRADSPGRRGTILLVEDEPSIRCGGRQLLELLDYRVLEAGDPHEAIWLASRFDGVIDLLIADVVLPGMTGGEMAERLVTAGHVSQVLYMSGLLKETLVERAAVPPHARFIEKPFTMAQLTERIRELLG